ncbi:DUF4846 domain-containing protein [bacterium]|nr:DUF4846 domain-containing protein [bacterium]
MRRIFLLSSILFCFSVGLLIAQSNTLSSRIDVPAGYKRISIPEGNFGATLKDLKLKPEATNARSDKGEDILCEDDIIAVFDEPSLLLKDGTSAASVIMLWGKYRWTKGKRTDIQFGLENGQKATWKDWSDGLRPRNKEGRILFMQVGVPDGSKTNYMHYLQYIAKNAGANSLRRDLQIVLPENLSPGDMIIATGIGTEKVGLVLDVCRNAMAEKLYLIMLGGENGSDLYLPRPYSPIQGEGAWFTLDGALYEIGRDNPTALRRFK